MARQRVPLANLEAEELRYQQTTEQKGRKVVAITQQYLTCDGRMIWDATFRGPADREAELRPVFALSARSLRLESEPS